MEIIENEQQYNTAIAMAYREKEGRNVYQNRLREGEGHETLPVETIQPIVCHCVHCHRSFANKAVKIVPKEKIFIFFRPETHEDMIHTQEKVVLEKL